MKKFLLQDSSNTKWVNAQEARAKTNTMNAQIRLLDYPELSRKSRATMDIEAAEARIKNNKFTVSAMASFYRWLRRYLHSCR
ncbi:hypothetical protein L914_04922, partial [Phytophthora nicotianae]